MTMHFLTKLAQTPQIIDPARKHMDVHKHFYRYGKGPWEGPSIKIKRRSSKINLYGMFEYEDAIQEIVAHGMSNGIEVDIIGRLLTVFNIQDTMKEKGIEWELVKSKGKKENYTADINEKASRQRILDLVKLFRKSSYLLVSFQHGDYKDHQEESSAAK